MDKIKELIFKGWTLLKDKVIKDWNGGFFTKGRLIFITGIIVIIIAGFITK